MGKWKETFYKLHNIFLLTNYTILYGFIMVWPKHRKEQNLCNVTLHERKNIGCFMISTNAKR